MGSLRRYLHKLVRILPFQRGKVRLARAIVETFGDQANAIVRDNGGNRYCVPSLLEPMSLEIMSLGVYEPETLEFIRQHAHGGSIVFEIGANIGVFTIPIAKLVAPGGHVFAVEASPKIFGYLQQNVTENRVLESVTMVNAAATATSQSEVSFYEADAKHFGMGSLGAWPQDGNAKVTVEGKTLDQLYEEWNTQPPALMKIDVEGFESDVFRGGSKLLTSPSAPVIIFEFVDWAEQSAGFACGEAQDVLMKFDFTLWRLGDWLASRSPLTAPVSTGTDMLVAFPKHRKSGDANG